MQTLQDAFVLHIRPYSESSQLVDVFTRHHGRVSLLVKGSRRAKSALKGVLQPFIFLRLSWSGKGSLKTLRSAEAQTHALPLPGDKLYLGLYLNELLFRLLEPMTAYPPLFDVYQQSLLALAKTERYEPLLRQFELQLLEQLGYMPDFYFDGENGEPIVSDRPYMYANDCGFLPVHQIPPGAEVYSGEQLMRMAAGELDSPDIARLCKRLCRQLINHQLGGKPLAARELFVKKARRK